MSTIPEMYSIRKINAADRKWIANFMKETWGGELVLVHDTRYYPAELDGFIAENENAQILGLLTYHIDQKECEIVTLNSLLPGKGIGSALIRQMKKIAAKKDCRRLWLVTTNDNLNALRFYQKTGFRLSKLSPGAVDKARQIKPGIPKIGEFGIPLRDEIELELHLLENLKLQE